MDKTPKPTSPHVGFYKSFGRPIAKVFLGAVFTYQVVYWTWVKLETEEIRERNNAQISTLEAEIRKARVRSPP
ncbi:hypothetical protein N7G274_001495 [Stereocaulon virgatum]|uniref:Uncharacterized protein n=1 Tax=Stereocaulon virgatum TaxID=373712 RepID=A0ABR4AJU2_9LECA